MRLVWMGLFLAVANAADATAGVDGRATMACNLEGTVVSKLGISSKQIRFRYEIASAANIEASGPVSANCSQLIGKTKTVQIRFIELSKSKAAEAKASAQFLGEDQTVKVLYMRAVITTGDGGGQTHEHWEFASPEIP